MKIDTNSFKNYCLSSFLVSNTTLNFKKGLGFAKDIFGDPKDEKSITLFSNYRESINKSLKDIKINSKLNTDLYCADSVFVCLGKYDFMGLALTDWPVFDTRLFMPNSPMLSESQEFEHYINRGFLLSSKKKKDTKSLKDFYSKSKAYDCIGMIKLKVNPFLLIGNGAQFTTIVKEKLQDSLDGETTSISLVLDSLDYCEFICYVFSNCPYEIVRSISRMRNFQIKDINEKLKKIILKNSLYPNYAHKICDENHLIYYTNSRIGFRFGCDQYKSKIKYKFILQFTLKPGHTKRFLSRLPDSLSSYKPIMTFGSTDLQFHDVDLLISEYLHLIEGISKHPIADDIIGMTSNLTSSKEIIENEMKDILYDESRVDGYDEFHFNEGSDILEIQQISLARIREVSKKMQALNISLNTQQRVLLMINTLNRSLVDHTNFSFFIELRKYVIEHILNQFYNRSTNFQVNHLEETLHDALNTYDIAFQNRFFKNHTLQEISDFRLSFNGGVHQLISLADSTYKVLTDVFSPRRRSYGSICYIGNRHDTISYDRALEINYSHLFFPSLFYIVVSHEAGNFLVEKTLRAYSDYNKSRTSEKNKISNNRLTSSENDFLTRLLLKLVKNYSKTETNEISQIINHNFRNQFDKVYESIDYNEVKVIKNRMNYIFVDLLNYYTTFNQDINLFIYYHWILILQSTEAYVGSLDQKHGEPKIKLAEEDYYTMYMRLAILCKLLGKGIKYLDEVFSIDPIYHYDDFVINIKSELDAFFAAKNFINVEDFFDAAKDFICLSLRESIAMSPKNIESSSTNEFLKNYKAEVKKNISKVKSSFTSFTPIYFDPDTDAQLIYITSIMYSHLKKEFEILKADELIKKYKPKILKYNPIILKQDIKGQIFQENQDWYINPRGGFTVLCPEKRKTIFKLNHTSMECLSDFSQKFKKVLFN